MSSPNATVSPSAQMPSLFAPELDERELPTSYVEVVTLFALTLVTCTILVGLLLAMAGVFTPPIVYPLILAATVFASRPIISLIRRASIRTTPIADIVVVASVLVWVAFGVVNSSQHVFADRDPGVYVLTGRWLAEAGRLPVDVRPDFVTADMDVVTRTPGFEQDRSDGRLSPQFSHGLPVLLAIAHWIGGDGGLFTVNAFAGGLALLTAYLLATRFLPRWWAALVPLSLGLNLVQIHFSRDVFAEPITEALLLGSLWAVFSLRPERIGYRLAGIFLAAGFCTRIDFLLTSWALAATLLGTTLIGAGRTDWRRIASLALPAVAGGAVGLTDLVIFSPTYFAALSEQAIAILGVFGLLCLVTLFMFYPPIGNTARSLFNKSRRTLAMGVPAALGLLVAYAFLLRPLGPPAHDISTPLVATLLEREGLPPDPSRSMAELTAVWLWWYLGPLVIAGMWGLLHAIRRTILEPSQRHILFVTIVATPLSVYLWRPSITPDQVWAMRRFLPAAIPGLVIFGMIAIHGWYRHCRKKPSRVAIGSLAVTMALFPAIRSVPVAEDSAYVGAFDLVQTTCRNLPEHAALFGSTETWSRIIAQPLRVYCRVPVVNGTLENLSPVMAQARDQGYVPLWYGRLCVPGGETVSSTTIQFKELEPTITRPPTRIITGYFSIVVQSESTENTESIDGQSIIVDPLAGETVSELSVEFTGGSNQVTGSDGRPILSDGGEDAAWWFAFAPDGRLTFTLRTNDGEGSVTSPLSVDDGLVRSYRVSYDGATLVLSCQGLPVQAVHLEGNVTLSENPILAQPATSTNGTTPLYLGKVAVSPEVQPGG